jgi:transcriptional regulator with XRE-family HTH domain
VSGVRAPFEDRLVKRLCSQLGLLTPMYIQIFETNVLRLLQERGLTKQQLAKKAGISLSLLSDLTHGKANPTLSTMESIADALDVSLPMMMEFTDLPHAQLAELKESSDRTKPRLPDGHERVSGIVAEFQAFQIKEWAESARKRLHGLTNKGDGLIEPRAAESR